MTRSMQRKCRAAALLAALTVLLALCPGALAASGDGPDTVEIAENGAVTLCSAHAAAEQVSSLQLQLSVAPAEGASVAFVFDGGLSGRLTTSSYRDGVLNIYIAGTAPLMAAGQTQLALGTITGGDLESVRTPENALQYVYGRRMIAQSVETKAAETVQDDPAPESDGRQALRQAIDAATQTYGQDAAIRGRYTPESWDALQEALISANELLGDPNASEEALAAALTALNNAVGGLKYAGKAALEAALEQARTYDPAGYTQDSFAQLQAAVLNAEAVLGDAGAAEADWENAAAQLAEAVGQLVPVAGADGSGPVIGDGPDSGTGSGEPEPGGGAPVETAPVPTLLPTAEPSAEPTDAPAAAVTDVPASDVPVTEAPSAAPAASPTASPAPANPGGIAPYTGDETAILPWMLALCLSGALLAVLLRRGGKCRR